MNREQFHPTHLTYAFERLRNEHIFLFDAIQQLETAAKRLGKLENEEEYFAKLVVLKEQTLNLMAELDGHSVWEDNELFPLLTEYFQLPNRPDTSTSLWMLEHEHELANTFFRYFLEEADKCLAGRKRPMLPRLTDHLMQACRLVKEHLLTEEETVLPLEEELVAGTDEELVV
ncbi:hemerythrin domain-containing protein [Paenibacillus sp. GD4]|uniref:hemerythrin domain-containing protein n=1 Tax=Paenibacillus sp. GD4 TaxID=3068890 RepID=UPI002796D379|nr:hemerythrin domain-containing protein [Paenibacillus sp. GD4]MDQ1909910.1 hemerythrin domain-containing protein [Paenibacillus sp. GD4]